MLPPTTPADSAREGGNPDGGITYLSVVKTIGACSGGWSGSGGGATAVRGGGSAPPTPPPPDACADVLAVSSLLTTSAQLAPRAGGRGGGLAGGAVLSLGRGGASSWPPPRSAMWPGYHLPTKSDGVSERPRMRVHPDNQYRSTKSLTMQGVKSVFEGGAGQDGAAPSVSP
jgi:hypothetical protein